MEEAQLWWLLIVASKFLWAFGLTQVLGHELWLDRKSKRQQIRCLMWLSGFVLLHLWIKVGEVSESGLMGLMDQDMFLLLWPNAILPVLQWHIAGIVLCLLTMNQTGASRHAIFCLWASFLAYALVHNGHVSYLSPVQTAALVLHVCLACWWLGSLSILKVRIYGREPGECMKLMTRYSRVAQYTVPLMLISALIVSWKHVNGTAFVLEYYEQVLGFKVLWVAIAFAFAIKHRGYVRQEVSEYDEFALRRSLSIEYLILVIAIVAAATLGQTMLTVQH